MSAKQRLIVCLLAVAALTVAVSGETDTEYRGKYEEAIKQAHLSTSQNLSTWDVKPVGSDFNCFPFVHLNPAESVHELTPYDIKIVGALGDSVTAAFGAKACTIIDDLIEYRGVSWSIGGDGSLSKVTTLPNIIKQYNPEVTGYSLKIGTQQFPNSHLNRAITGAIAQDMPKEARDLVDKMKKMKNIDIENDWKVVTMWIGGNNLCAYCNDKEKHSPDNYINGIQEALDYLHENLPRTFVNVVQIIDITKLKDTHGLWCSTVHQQVCKCFDDLETSEVSSQYQIKVDELVNSGRYDTRDDFTVVVQPFMKGVEVPRLPNNEMDMSYLAPDCFHFSTKGHREGAVALWNNMIEPVGSKTEGWTPGGSINCPVKPYYFFTKKNSQVNSVSEGQNIPDNSPSEKDTIHQPGSGTAAIIAGSVVAVVVVAVALVALSVFAGLVVRRRSQRTVQGESMPLVDK